MTPWLSMRVLGSEVYIIIAVTLGGLPKLSSLQLLLLQRQKVCLHA